jgi:hypothetical protein
MRTLHSRLYLWVFLVALAFLGFAHGVAATEPLLKSITLRATQVWLQRGDSGPVWKVRLWAAKLKNTMDDADIGDDCVAATDGKVLGPDLHINSVD